MILCDTNSDQVVIPQADLPALASGAWTIIGWLYPTTISPGNSRELFTIGSSATPEARIRKNSNDRLQGYCNGSNTGSANGQVLTENVWWLIALSYDGAGTLSLISRKDGDGSSTRTTVTSVTPANASTGMLWCAGPSVVGQQGAYHAWAFRSHGTTQAEFDAIFEAAQEDGVGKGTTATYGYTSGTNWTATTGCRRLWHYGGLKSPEDDVSGSPTSGINGEALTATNCLIYDADNAVEPTSFVHARDITLTGTITIGSPHDAPYSGFFGRAVPGTGPTPVAVVRSADPILQSLASGTPTSVTRVIVSSNSRGVRITSSDGIAENWGSGIASQRLATMLGWFNRAPDTNSGRTHYVFDTTNAPVNSGTNTLIGESSPGSSWHRDLGRYWTGSNHASGLPGRGLHMAASAVYEMKGRVEAGTLIASDQPFKMRLHALKFPGASQLTVAPCCANAQNSAGTVFATGSVNVTMDSTRGGSSGLAVTTVNSQTSIVFSGDQSSKIIAGDVATLTDSGGTSVRGIALVASVSVSTNTTVTLEYAIHDTIVVGDLASFGPLSLVSQDYEFNASSQTGANGGGLTAADISASRTWRGLKLTAGSGFGCCILGFDGWRTGANGFLFGCAGHSGNGYTPQLAEQTAAVRAAWMQAVDPDVWWQVFAQQSSDETSMLAYTSAIRSALPSCEILWAGEGAHDGNDYAAWHTYIIANATANSVSHVAALEHPDLGTYLEQVGDLDRADGSHLTGRGVAAHGAAWLELMAAGIQAATAGRRFRNRRDRQLA